MGTLSVDKILKTSTGAAEFTLPATDGTVGQVWQTDGSGQISVAALAADTVTATQIADNAVVTNKVSDGALTAAKLVANSITPAQMADSAFLANRNTIINGAMEISQRSTSVAAITTDGYYTLDRWKVFNDTLGTFTMSQSTTAPSDQGFRSSLKMDCTTADASPSAADRVGVRQFFEGYDIQQFKYATSNAESLTLSFWVRSSKIGTYIAELYGVTPNRQISKAYTISVADTWEKKTITFAGDTGGTYNNDNSGELLVSFYLGVGSNYSSGTLNQSWADYVNANRAVGQVNVADSTSGDWYITGIQLEIGTTATPFEHTRVDQQLQACLRYYQIVNMNWWSYGISGTIIDSFVRMIPEMRASPSVTLLDTTPTFQKVNVANYTGTNSSITTSSITYLQAFVRIDGFSGISANGDYLMVSPNMFAFAAEL